MYCPCDAVTLLVSQKLYRVTLSHVYQILKNKLIVIGSVFKTGLNELALKVIFVEISKYSLEKVNLVKQ